MQYFDNEVTITDDTNWNTVETLPIDSTSTYVMYIEVLADGVCHTMTGVFKNGVQLGTTLLHDYLSSGSSSQCQFAVDSSNVYVQVKNVSLLIYNSFASVDWLTP